jgi:hypothetical protein
VWLAGALIQRNIDRRRAAEAEEKLAAEAAAEADRLRRVASLAASPSNLKKEGG